MNPLQATVEAIEHYAESGQCDQLAAWKVRALITGYHDRWKSAPFGVLGVEETFQLPIVNPETGRSSRTYQQGGRFDLMVNFDSRTWMVEHKTTSEEIADPSASYWRRLAIDGQVSMYALANWQSGRKLDGTIYDVIRKPTIRPKQITKADQKTMIEALIYCEFSIDEEDVAEADGNEFSETPKLYSLRLLRDCLDNPGKYYQRRPVPRLDNEMLEWAGELWQVAQDIRTTESSGAHYRNSGACMNFGRPCDYLGLCSGHDTPESDKWRKRDEAHPEVKFDANTLTHSRIRCYQTCRRMHFYKYLLRLERADDETAEALVFGQLLHRALEVYYNALKDQQHGISDSAPAASEVAGNESQIVTV